MSNEKIWSPRRAWLEFRLETEVVKNYPLSYALYVGQTHENILLEKLLPTLLYIKGASILDDSLTLWLDDSGHKLRKPYKNDFNGRICYIDDNLLYDKCAELHTIRNKRNNFAHKPSVHTNWHVLESDMLIIENCLFHFGLVAKTQKLEFFAERSGLKESNDPKVAFTCKYSYGVKENGKPKLKIEWNQDTLNE